MHAVVHTNAACTEVETAQLATVSLQRKEKDQTLTRNWISGKKIIRRLARFWRGYGLMISSVNAQRRRTRQLLNYSAHEHSIVCPNHVEQSSISRVFQEGHPSLSTPLHR